MRKRPLLRGLLFLGGRLGDEELGLVGLDGVEESVEVVGAGCGEFGRNEMQAARSVQRVALRGIF